MLGTMINVITAPGETFETIVKEFNWKQALLPIGLLMGLAVVSGFVSAGINCGSSMGTNTKKY